MDAGSDPGQDDFGLPPVDIEIPDDARELDRDVQAYHRKLRAQRRRMVASRLPGPLMRDGLALPLIAGCLALTLLAGTLLAVFMADRSPFGSAPRASTAPARHSPVVGQVGAPLPDAIVTVDGQRQSLRGLAGTVRVLALIPPRCQCLRDVRQLTIEAYRASAQIYLVGVPGVPVLWLSKQVGLGVAHAVEDSENALPPSYHPATLTAIIVRANGTVARIVADHRGFQLQAELESLSSSAHQ